MRLKVFAWVLSVHLFRKGGKRSQVYSVAHFKHVEVVIAYVHSQQVGDARPVSRSRAHPHDVMISPLEVNVVVIQQIVHNLVRVSSSVEDISDNVQLVYGKSADCLCQLDYVLLRHAAFYHRIDNLSVIVGSVCVVIGMEQLVHAVIHVLRQAVTNPGAGILGGHRLTNRNQAINSRSAPVVKVLLAFLSAGDFRLCIVNQRSQIVTVPFAENRAVMLVDFGLDGTRRTFEHMNKRLVLPMEVTEKILRTLRQRQYGLQVDDFRRCRHDVRVVLGEPV